ncbi:hypothetical protein JCM8097_002820 [Rhodosporidiobolus ruineniae]
MSRLFRPSFVRYFATMVNAPPQLVTLPRSAPLEDVLAVMRRDGGASESPSSSSTSLLEARETVAPMVEKAEPEEETFSEAGVGFVPSNTTRVYGLLGKAPSTMVKILQDKLWQGVMGEFLTTTVETYSGKQLVRNTTGYQLNAAVAITALPGAEAQVLHRDQIVHSFEAEEGSLRTSMCAALIALTDITKENGGTAVIPGSHLWPKDRVPDESECAYTEMSSVSALFTLGSVYHGAGANTAAPSSPNATRTLMAIFGTHDWLRQEENIYATVPLAVARKLPEDVLRIAGWAKSAGGAGFVEHRDPIDFLHVKGPGGLEESSFGFAVAEA